MRYVLTDHQHVLEIANDLKICIPLGTLNLFNLPKQYCLCGPIANNWSWFDIEYFTQFMNESNDLITSLTYLGKHKFITATYKINHIGLLSVCKVRLYTIPQDVEGARYFHSWRRNLRVLDKEYKLHLENLIRFIDFSKHAWNTSIIDSIRNGIEISLIDLKSIQPISNYQQLNFHIHRWHRKMIYNSSKDSFTSEKSNSLTEKIKLIYNSVLSPKISKFDEYNHLEIDGLVQLAKQSKLGHVNIKGITSLLYPFQMRSVLSMLSKEKNPGKCISPNFLPMTSIDDKIYYVDLFSLKIHSNPEWVSLPRGGIVAENMGLGKTLICLSLICLTKFEMSKRPQDVLLIDVECEPSLKSLSELCRDVIAGNSLPWKQFSKSLPPSMINYLSDSPGYFHIPLKQNTKNSRKESNLTESQKLYTCSTTLIIVPENLFSQWNTEVKKHLQHDYLRILYISPYFTSTIETESNKYVNKILDAVTLTKYDMILLSTSCLAKSTDLLINPLSQIYWKRVIIDEGHSMTSKSSKAAQFSKALNSERKWAVTGTPTSGLTRLDMDERDQSQTSKKYMVKTDFNERTDLMKLGTIFANFLKIEPFHSQPKYWSTQIVKPLIDGIYGSSSTLSNLLNSVMVRHNLSDVEHDLKLPKLHHEVTILKPSFHNALSVNLFNSVLAVNAVTSERTDIDYMFHPSNRTRLRQLILNLQRASCHWTGFSQEEIESLIKICNNCLNKNNYNEKDTNLLRKSIQVAEYALSNPRWKNASLLHEMNYYVEDLPKPFTSFAFGSQNTLSILGAPHLNALQEFFYKNRFTNFNDIPLKSKSASTEFWTKYWNINNQQKKVEKFGKQTNESRTKSNNFEIKERVEKTIDFEPDSISPFDTFDKIKRVEILGSASSKLSYLSSKLLDHQRSNIKSIVFFEFEDSAYYLTEMLDVLGVNYLLYATFITPTKRAKNLSDFANYDLGGLTLIMDIKLAAHGLTIISATRVYFMSPVWQQSVEAQAIKRAHRIGQTENVFVETLILEGTLEEEIYKRRSIKEATDHNKYVIDDLGIQHYILQHNFLDLNYEYEYAPFTFPVGDIKEEKSNADDDEYNLLKHVSITLEKDGKYYKKWRAYLFSQENLTKLNNLRMEKSRVRGEQESFVTDLTNNVDETGKDDKKRKLVFHNSTMKKKVRF